jgi:membrane fusion protein (multidrug efflux system)
MGTLRAAETVALKPEAAGRISRIGFREGDSVRKGQLLFSLDDEALQAERSGKRASVGLLAAECRQMEALVSSQQAAPIELDRKRAELAVARSALAVLEVRIRQMSIVAPFDGVTGTRQVSLGDYIQPGQPLVTISSFSPVKAVIRLPETRADVIRVGQPVALTVDVLPGVLLQGRVTVIEPQLDIGTRAVWLRAEFRGGDPRLRGGMTATARLEAGSRSGQWVKLPEQAVVAQGGKTVVYRVADRKATPVPVVIGSRADGKVEVSGVKPGETIVVSCQNKLAKPGMPVETVPLREGR